MEVVELSHGAKPVTGVARGNSERDRIPLKRKTLEETLDQCQQFLQLLGTTGCDQDDDESEDEATDDDDNSRQQISRRGSLPPSQDGEADMLCSLIKSRIKCPDFLAKLESAQVLVPHKLAEESTWDMVSENDLWEGGNIGSNEDDYVLVSQGDIVDGIACFMAAYLLSLEETKDLTPDRLQDALSRTFSSKKKKGRLQKAWDGSKVIYNVASWGATAIGIYQNPVILRAASGAFWTSCNVISKLL